MSTVVISDSGACEIGAGGEMELGSEWEQVCRVCLQSGTELVSLFDCDENNELLRDKYHYCSDIEVSETEPLPSNICLTCVDRLLSAYQFKQQCLSSYDTLKECLSEFKKSNSETNSSNPVGTEIITIKQEDGMYIQYEIPVEHDNPTQWPNFKWLGTGEDKKDEKVKKRNRGRPRKYPNALGFIVPSPYNRKKDQTELLSPKEEYTSKDVDEFETYTLDEKSGENVINRLNNPKDEEEIVNDITDPDYVPENEKDIDEHDSDEVLRLTIDPSDGTFLQLFKKADEKGGKRKNKIKKTPIEIMKIENESEEKDDEDVLLKETILANSEPIPDNLLNPQPKEKKCTKKIYKYDRVHTCEQCGSSFRSNASLQAHIRRHLGIKPYTCSICGYACVLNMELRRHMMRHTGVKPYKCRICERHFGDFGSRQKHERLHVGDRPYHCNICGKSFTYSYVLSNHMLTHTGEKKYECTLCNKKFTKAHHLKYHNRIHHKELYQQQQLIQEAKKMQQVHISELTTVCTEQLLGLNQDGTTLQIQDGSIRQASVIDRELMEHTVENHNLQDRSLGLIDSQDMSDDKTIKENIQIIQQYNNGNLKCEPIHEVKIEDGLL